MALGAHDLVFRIERIVEDLGSLSAAAVIGFTGDGDRALEALAGSTMWSYADLRDGGNVAAVRDKPVAVIAVRAAKLSREVIELIRDVVDHKHTGKLIVCCDGAASYDALPIALKRIDYSNFV